MDHLSFKGDRYHYKISTITQAHLEARCLVVGSVIARGDPPLVRAVRTHDTDGVVDQSFDNAKRSIYYTKSLLQNLYYKMSNTKTLAIYRSLETARLFFDRPLQGGNRLDAFCDGLFDHAVAYA